MTARRFGVVLLTAAAVSVAAAGCGRTSSAIGNTVPSVPVVSSIAGSAQTPPTTAPPAAPATASPSTATATSSLPGGSAGANSSASTDLTAIESDIQAVDAGTNQSDSDFNAGTSAQSQPDQP